MGWDNDKYLDVLQNIEFAIVSVYQEHADLRDREVMQALDAAIEFYRADMRGHTPKPHKLQGRPAVIFGRVQEMSEYRRGRAAFEDAEGQQRIPPGEEKTAEEILSCLRQIRKSVERWSNQAGPQGYLQFVSEYVG
jgi:hypothetical protein